MMTPLVSILVPAYNHERYIEQAIRSVIEQDWPRLELVLIDDGSKDGTWDIAQRLRDECEQSIERVVMVRRENKGMVLTLNELFEMSRGEFVAVLASDDMYLPRAISSMMRAMSDPEVGLVVGQNEIMDGDGRHCYWNNNRDCVYQESEAKYKTFNEYLTVKTGIAENSPGYGSYHQFIRTNHIPNGQLLRRTAYQTALPYSQETPLDDVWMHLQVSKVAKYRAVPEHTFRYRWHAANSIKQRARMGEFNRRTMRHEHEQLVRKGDLAHLAVFEDGINKVRWSFSLGWGCAIRRVKNTIYPLDYIEIVIKNKHFRFGSSHMQVVDR